MLKEGTRLGRYEIRSLLGAGGMGEVYLARDKQLDRTVALKILLAEVVSNQERLRRFVREAKAAAAPDPSRPVREKLTRRSPSRRTAARRNS